MGFCFPQRGEEHQRRTFCFFFRGWTAFDLPRIVDWFQKKKRSDMINGQLELSIANETGCRASGRRQRRSRQAHWWFERMRATVDRAIDWAPADPPRSHRLRSTLAR